VASLARPPGRRARSLNEQEPGSPKRTPPSQPHIEASARRDETTGLSGTRKTNRSLPILEAGGRLQFTIQAAGNGGSSGIQNDVDPTDGSKSESLFTTVWKREGGDWRVWSAHWTDMPQKK
jgi:hypothetical protein